MRGLQLLKLPEERIVGVVRERWPVEDVVLVRRLIELPAQLGGPGRAGGGGVLRLF